MHTEVTCPQCGADREYDDEGGWHVIPGWTAGEWACNCGSYGRVWYSQLPGDAEGIIAYLTVEEA